MDVNIYELDYDDNDNNNKIKRSNYRPITCLPTSYKILTAAISNLLDIHLDKNNILPTLDTLYYILERKGCQTSKNLLLIKKQVVLG